MPAPDLVLSPRFLIHFVETLLAETGRKNLAAVLEKDGLPGEWIDMQHLSGLQAAQTAGVYAGLQAALSTYYGRGARGSLLRIGAQFWLRLLDQSGPGVKARALVVRALPSGMRRKPALDLLAGMLNKKPGLVTTHTLDLDLLLVDRASPTTLGQKSSTPICHVTQGLIREAMYWAVGREHDVEEVSCRATGKQNCEFKISTGGTD